MDLKLDVKSVHVTGSGKEAWVEITGASDAEILEHFKIAEVISHFGVSELLEHIGRGEAIDHWNLTE